MHFKSVCFSYIFLLFNPFTELLSKTGCLFLSVCSSVYPILHGCVCIAPPLHCHQHQRPGQASRAVSVFRLLRFQCLQEKNNHPTSLLVKTVEPRDKSGKRVSRRRQQEEWHPQGPVARPVRSVSVNICNSQPMLQFYFRVWPALFPRCSNRVCFY